MTNLSVGGGEGGDGCYQTKQSAVWISAKALERFEKADVSRESNFLFFGVFFRLFVKKVIL